MSSKKANNYGDYALSYVVILKTMLVSLRGSAIRFLRWTEKYTKTDMVYLFQTGFWMNLNNIMVTVLSLLLSIAFANLLSPATYGAYQYLISLSALAGSLMLGGMASAVTQAVARSYEGVLVTSVRAQLRWAVIPALLSLLGAIYYFINGNNEVGFGLVCIALLTPLVNSFSTYGAFLNGKKEFRQGFYFSTIVTLTYYASIFLAIIFLKSAPFLIFVNLASNTLATIYVYHRTLKLYKPNKSVDPTTLSYGKHLSIINTFGTILTQLDSILVFHFLGPVQLAVYSFASMIPERAAGFFNFVGAAAMPKFANQSLESIRENIFSKVLRTAIAGSIITLLYILAAPFLFRLLFPQYLSAIIYTQIYAPVILLMAVVNVTNTTLYAKRLTREIYVVGFIQPVLLIGLQLPLLLLYGILGCL